MRALVGHWVLFANAFLLAFATLPALAPLLHAGGMRGSAGAIVAAYSLVCHQLPGRSYFLAGYQMAYCERDTALYASMAIAGLVWARWHKRLPRMHWSVFLLLALPMAIDGFSQLTGLRESTWELRTLTGALFGLGCVWFGFPLLNTTVRLLRIALRCRPIRLASA
ncbi:MAG TPA: DUF2085 domain-containing protein [Chloroflexota bacterium]|nr:DUF2085 domain-containing protein [Chloroflexota bacterium]